MANSTIKASVTEAINTGITNCWASKRDGLASLSFSFATMTASAGGWYTIGTLPESLRPKSATTFCAFRGNCSAQSDSTVVQMKITTTGALQMYLFSDGLTQGPYGSVTYLTAT